MDDITAVKAALGDLEMVRREQATIIEALSPPVDGKLVRPVEDGYEIPVGCMTKITLKDDGSVEMVARSAVTGATSKVVGKAKSKRPASKPKRQPRTR